MIFESKEQELMFMNVLWLRLFYLQEHLKDEIQVASKWFVIVKK